MPSNHLIHAMLSHPGLVRRGNEDACAAAPEAGAFVVCDGMGGAAAGEVASRLAAETFLARLTEAAADNGSLAAHTEARLGAAVNAANQAVYRQSRRSPKLAGMGTTLVALAAPDAANAIWITHVGDSRCYRLRHGHLQQLTNDHSLVAEQLRAGQITPTQAACSPMRNYITRAIGSESDVEAEIQSRHVQTGDLYLLASDGLTHDVADIEIESILAGIPIPATQPVLAETCEALISAANRNGGHDNITVLLAAVAVG
ncbi:MAG: serine/threonine protein phosphatase [Acidobacteriales bacterium 59-55]|nr:Stp1/IreP family PP2C-type Ser/Thr phosphatase [Terriglobales bacterium]ODU54467.1 MAG: serine/threonine protein phosphatase [Granulicella sp. SCN 62-9]OJV43391.1 MAG: serine/threonine protein phosphatase [Acidobacteriales bacterium 59-55]